jgi:hypothetical protein
LLGFVYSEQEYKHYFDGFLTAQRLRVSSNRNPSALDRVKDNMNWNSQYQLFLTTEQPMSQINVVADYKQQMKNAASGGVGGITKGFNNMMNRKWRR